MPMLSLPVTRGGSGVGGGFTRRAVWVVVGWSPELVAAALKSANVGLAAPRSGTSLWADLWVSVAAPTHTCSRLISFLMYPACRDWALTHVA
jgi:spermidine/putrescine-binding protein